MVAVFDLTDNLRLLEVIFVECWRIDILLALFRSLTILRDVCQVRILGIFPVKVRIDGGELRLPGHQLSDVHRLFVEIELKLSEPRSLVLGLIRHASGEVEVKIVVDTSVEGDLVTILMGIDKVEATVNLRLVNIDPNHFIGVLSVSPQETIPSDTL